MNRHARQQRIRGKSPRLVILELFERTMPRHLTAAEIFERVLTQGEDIGMPTIYRVLFQLEADLLVERRNVGGGTVYARRRGLRPEAMVGADAHPVDAGADAGPPAPWPHGRT